MANKKYTSKNEFRYCKKTKHTAYIFEDDGKKYNAVGLTTNSTTFGKPNMPLDVNPQKGKTDKAYVRNGIIRERHKSFGDKPRKSFRFSDTDFPKVKAKIRNYKKERKRRQENGNKAFLTVSFIIVIVIAVFVMAKLF